MRRSLPVPLGLAFLLAATWWPGGVALAQQQPSPSVTLRLASQSAWNSPRRPLELTLEATNDGPAALGVLSVELFIDAPARSRSAYEASLHSDVTSGLLAVPFVQSGTLEPGQTRTFSIRQPLDTLSARGESALYPLKIELRSRDAPVAALRSPMVFLIERPKVPLNLAWTWVLAAPVEFGPDGRFLPGSLESAVAPGGRLDAMTRALERAAPRALDLVMSPVLADQLRRMASGYRAVDSAGRVRTVAAGTAGAADAASLLARLRKVAGEPATETVALPFGDAVLPALGRSGLLGDLPALIDRGRRSVESALGVRPAAAVARPPLSELDATSLAVLTALGPTTVLLDPNYVATPPGPTGRPLPVVTVTAEGASLAAVVPDAGVTTLAAASPADPLLAARAALGELAATWLEFPGTPGRGAAVIFPERGALPPDFYGDFAAAVRASPWLRPLTASSFVSTFAQPGRTVLPRRSFRGAGGQYVRRLLTARSELGQFQRVTRGSRELVDRLRDELLLSEGSTSIIQPRLGRQFIDAVRARIDQTYDRVRVYVPGGLVTLASQNAPVPLTISNTSDYAIRARIVLLADRRLTFVDGDSRPIMLPRASRVFTFRVHARTTGRFPIKVQLRTSDAPTATTIAEAQIVVRSTAYNRLALFLTIGAALFMLAWWGRRFLPRRKS